MCNLGGTRGRAKEQGKSAHGWERGGKSIGKYQAMQLMICLEQVDALARVARQIHGYRPAAGGGLDAVDGDEAMRRVDGVPELVVQGVVVATVGSPPVPWDVGCWKGICLRC